MGDRGDRQVIGRKCDVKNRINIGKEILTIQHEKPNCNYKDR
jgi:hypothetical protein